MLRRYACTGLKNEFPMTAIPRNIASDDLACPLPGRPIQSTRIRQPRQGAGRVPDRRVSRHSGQPARRCLVPARRHARRTDLLFLHQRRRPRHLRRPRGGNSRQPRCAVQHARQRLQVEIPRAAAVGLQVAHHVGRRSLARHPRRTQEIHPRDCAAGSQGGRLGGLDRNYSGRNPHPRSRRRVSLARLPALRLRRQAHPAQQPLPEALSVDVGRRRAGRALIATSSAPKPPVSRTLRLRRSASSGIASRAGCSSCNWRTNNGSW